MMAGNADELRRNVREATFLKLCVTGGVVGGKDRLADTRPGSAASSTDIDEPTAALMAARGVALVRTFAVVERLLHDPAAAGRRWTRLVSSLPA
jgi:hypothetical protein